MGWFCFWWSCIGYGPHYSLRSRLVFLMFEPSNTIWCSSGFGEDWKILFCSKYVIINNELPSFKLINANYFQFWVISQTEMYEWPGVKTIYIAAAGPGPLFPSKTSWTSNQSRTVKSQHSASNSNIFGLSVSKSTRKISFIEKFTVVLALGNPYTAWWRGWLTSVLGLGQLPNGARGPCARRRSGARTARPLTWPGSPEAPPEWAELLCLKFLFDKWSDIALVLTLICATSSLYILYRILKINGIA